MDKIYTIMKTIVFLIGFLVFSSLTSYSQTFNEIKKILASDDASGDEYGFSVDIYGDYAVVGSRGDDDNGSNSGAAYIYYRNQGGTDNWGQIKKITPSDGAAGDQFGFDVTIYGDNIAVGAHVKASYTGAVYVFNRNQGGPNNWGQVKKVTASDAGGAKAFGLKVELDGTTLVVGANEHFLYSGGFYYPVGPGSAYVFYQNQGGTNNWGQVKKVTPSDGVSGDAFGYLDIDGDYLVVASHFKNSYQGAAYIFYRNQGGTDNWGQVKKIVPPISSSVPTYGLGIDVSGDNIAIGSYYESGGGFVYVYNRNQGGTNNWGQVKKFKGSTVSSGYWFGTSVTMENDILVVGAAGNGSSGGNGQAYVFKQNQGGTNNWGQTQILTASDGAYNDQFGFSLAMHQGRIIVGAVYNDDGGTNSGSAYIFANCVSSPATSISATVNPVCQGSSTTLSLVGGYLGTGATWRWYSGSCGGTLVGTGTSISVSPTSSTTYYVRAEGSCNTTTCASLLVNVTVPQTANNTTSTAAICEGNTKALTGTPSGGTWSIVSGGGSITGSTYTAPSVASNTSVIIKYRIPASGPCPADSANVTFTVTNSVPVTNTTNTSAICETGTKSLTGTPSGGTWSIVSGGGSITGTTYNPPNISSNTTVTVKYRVNGSGGCPADSANVTFTVQPTITPTITSSAADMCSGDTRALTGTPAGGTWSVVSGPGNITGTTLTATGSGTIQVRYRIVNACGNNDVTQNITVSNTIVVAVTSSNASLCEGDTISLTGTPAGGTWTLLSPTAGTLTGNFFTASGQGIANIRYDVTSSCGNGDDTINIVTNPLPNTSAGLDENICIGDTVTLMATGGVSYQWNPGPASANNQVFPTVTTGYRVDVTSDSGCVASDSVTVFLQTPGVVDAQNDQGVVVTGASETVDIYSNDIGSVNSIQIIGGPSNGTATLSNGNVVYTSNLGFIGNDTIGYVICDAVCEVICDTAFVYLVVDNDLTIPVGVSPNDDGKNDVFNILGISRYPDNHLYIYNRWGSLVFEAQPYLNDWNGQNTSGSLMGNEVIEGTYFYILELGEDIPARKGYIELKK